MDACLSASTDRIDAVSSLPPERKLTSDFGRKVILDLSSREKEFENGYFPLNIIFDIQESDSWTMGYQEFFGFDAERIKKLFRFKSEVIMPFHTYKVPVIRLLKETPKEAVCQVFENVNTGGVALTVFELLTATYAADGFNLSNDWKERKESFIKTDPVLKHIRDTDFLMSVCLLSSYKRKQSGGDGAVSCKRKDILDMPLSEYKPNAQELMAGIKRAARFLHTQKIFDSKNLPYQTQLVPLFTLCTLLGDEFEKLPIRDKLRRWYWCGVMGELYGGANETRFSLDVQQFPEWILDDSKTPITVTDANFSPSRLLTLQTRNSAAYKGVMALLMQGEGSRDLINGDPIQVTTYFDEAVDIHHLFPQAYCESSNLPRIKYNSIINKAPLTSSTNRALGGKSPSEYLNRIQSKHKITDDILACHLKSHLADYNLMKTDSFDEFIAHRATGLLNVIQSATGKTITGRDSEETILSFGNTLI